MSKTGRKRVTKRIVTIGINMSRLEIDSGTETAMRLHAIRGAYEVLFADMGLPLIQSTDVYGRLVWTMEGEYTGSTALALRKLTHELDNEGIAYQGTVKDAVQPPRKRVTLDMGMPYDPFKQTEQDYHRMEYLVITYNQLFSDGGSSTLTEEEGSNGKLLWVISGWDVDSFNNAIDVLKEEIEDTKESMRSIGVLF